RPFLDKNGFDFTFSGIKSAVNRIVQSHPEELPALVPHIATGFQEAVVDVLTHKLIAAAEHQRCDRIALVGGVAANRRLRERIREAGAAKGMAVHIPSPEFCGDNAAMIAAVGYHYLQQGIRGKLGDDVFSRNKP
nr:tRNA (adenosine(37)-N6)-threonylcarbamoyltransferase complex transferase subunit TsaD [Desulfobacterales bacterium]